MADEPILRKHKGESCTILRLLLHVQSGLPKCSDGAGVSLSHQNTSKKDETMVPTDAATRDAKASEKSRSIALDAFNLTLPKGYGIATYTRNLNDAIRAIGYQTQLVYGPERGVPNDPLLAQINLFDSPKQKPSSGLMATLSQSLRVAKSPFFGRKVRPVPVKGEVMTDQVARHAPLVDGIWAGHDIFHTANRAYSAFGKFTSIRFEAGAAAPNLMHWTCPLPLRAPGRPNIYTLHDLVPLRLPYTTTSNKRRYLSLCREICASADMIATVSEISKQDLVRILGVPETKVAVTYQAVNLPPAILAADESVVAAEVQSMFGLGWRDYFVFYGAIEPKKNLARVIEAYLTSGVESPLLVIGGKGWLDKAETQLLYPDLLQASAPHEGALRRGERVRCYEYMPFGLLTSLVRGARAVLAPFLYEGFGLPMLEAMQLGTPVLGSTGGAMPEVAGDAALLVNPYDVNAIRGAIRTLDADADLRQELSVRGRQQALVYSPEAYRTRLLELYRPFV
jgi:glycosyltransferase involved in cell wall biosynthesis